MEKVSLTTVACVSAGVAAAYACYRVANVLPTLSDSEVKAINAADREKFTAAYERIVADALFDSQLHPPEIVSWMRKCIDYNIPGGKNTRGLSVLQAVRCLKPSLLLDPEVHFRVCALGWCVEWLQGMFLVADDIMDHSPSRRGKACWYKVEGVDMIAINDVLMLEALIYRLLKSYWSKSPAYAAILDLFHEVTFETTVGELDDLLTAPIGQVDLSKYSMTNYKHIVKYKTSLYSFYLPVAIAMLVAGVKDPAEYKTARDICCHIGEYFQVQDDYLDCYGDPKVIGKIGTDIEDNKCSWLVCKALPLMNEDQKKRLNANYGVNDPTKVNVVKAIYKELQLEDIYKKYEVDSFSSTQEMIKIGASRHSKPIYTWLLNRIYKRTK